MVDLEAVWSRVLKDTSVEHSSIHGPCHWARVERNGLYVAQKTGANQTIVQLFAVFHDCMRQNDHIDPGHGRRGAEYAFKSKMNSSIFPRTTLINFTMHVNGIRIR